MQASSTPTLAELTDVQIAEIAQAAGEPAWMIEQRTGAWAQFADAIPPIWRRTDLSKFRADLVTAPTSPQGTAVQFDESLAAQGVVFMPLATALREHTGLVQQYFGKAVDPNRHKFASLHTALWQDGVLVYVPKNVAVELPLRAIFTLPDGGKAVFPHNLIILDRGASATFVEEFVSPDTDEQALASPVTEVFVGEGATLRYITAQTWGASVYNLGAQIARVERDGKLEWVAVNLGSRVQHIEAETYLGGNGSHVQWNAATLATGKQSLLTAPWLRHVGENTEGHMDFKTVVNQGGYTTFDGMIKIEHDSKSTVSRLEEHALHLSPDARSDSIPGLKIDTNDVQQAGHASTSGQVDDEQLFYMLSRGIKRDDAVNMIVTGFFEPVLDRIPLEDLRDRLSTIVASKI